MSELWAVSEAPQRREQCVRLTLVVGVGEVEEGCEVHPPSIHVQVSGGACERGRLLNPQVAARVIVVLLRLRRLTASSPLHHRVIVHRVQRARQMLARRHEQHETQDKRSVSVLAALRFSSHRLLCRVSRCSFDLIVSRGLIVEVALDPCLYDARIPYAVQVGGTAVIVVHYAVEPERGESVAVAVVAVAGVQRLVYVAYEVHDVLERLVAQCAGVGGVGELGSVVLYGGVSTARCAAVDILVVVTLVVRQVDCDTTTQ